MFAFLSIHEASADVSIEFASSVLKYERIAKTAGIKVAIQYANKSHYFIIMLIRLSGLAISDEPTCFCCYER